MFKRKYLVFLLLLTLVLAACQADPEQVEVIVTRVVEQIEEMEVTRVVEQTVTEEVEVEVTRVVEVEAPAPVAGRCAPTDPGEVEEILIGASAPLSKPGSVTGGLVMQAAFSIAVQSLMMIL